jgi:hypothetical protein
VLKKDIASCNVLFNDLPFLKTKRGGLDIALNSLNEAIWRISQNVDVPFDPDLLYLKNVRYRAPIPSLGTVVRAICDYQDGPNYLIIKQGDTIKLISRHKTGWCDGISNGRRGWFPMNYCTAADV